MPARRNAIGDPRQTSPPAGSYPGWANCTRRHSKPIASSASEVTDGALLLIISRQAPWSGPSAREALDIVLAGGAFELPLGLLFLDDGVFQLAPAQLAASVEQKDLTANLQALPLFGIDALFAARRSLSERQLAESTLALPVEVLDDAGLRA